MYTSAPVILVVEDDVFIRFAAVDLVESAGYAAREANGADAAIRIMDAGTHIDLVFTDVDMPGSMDGLALTHYIRERWPQVQIIVTSGRELIDAALLPEGGLFVPKPYSDDTILEEMALMLSTPASSASGKRASGERADDRVTVFPARVAANAVIGAAPAGSGAEEPAIAPPIARAGRRG